MQNKRMPVYFLTIDDRREAIYAQICHAPKRRDTLKPVTSHKLVDNNKMTTQAAIRPSGRGFQYVHSCPLPDAGMPCSAITSICIQHLLQSPGPMRPQSTG
jgi:hypothetical protein